MFDIRVSEETSLKTNLPNWEVRRAKAGLGASSIEENYVGKQGALPNLSDMACMSKLFQISNLKDIAKSLNTNHEPGQARVTEDDLAQELIRRHIERHSFLAQDPAEKRRLFIDSFVPAIRYNPPYEATSYRYGRLMLLLELAPEPEIMDRLSSLKGILHHLVEQSEMNILYRTAEGQVRYPADWMTALDLNVARLNQIRENGAMQVTHNCGHMMCNMDGLGMILSEGTPLYLKGYLLRKLEGQP
jgi:hypothetical protein